MNDIEILNKYMETITTSVIKQDVEMCRKYLPKAIQQYHYMAQQQIILGRPMFEADDLDLIGSLYQSMILNASALPSCMTPVEYFNGVAIVDGKVLLCDPNIMTDTMSFEKYVDNTLKKEKLIDKPSIITKKDRYHRTLF
jgi:hypothetical protein